MNPANILVVEDEALTATLLEHLLGQSGYAVVAVVPSGEEAVEKAGELKPDLILMDIQLVGSLDGIDAACRIRSCYGIPIIFLTAYADENTLQRARVSEPLGYMVKPFRKEELIANVEMALYKSKIQALRERERELTSILGGLDQGVITFDIEGHVCFMNPLAERIIGMSLSEAQCMEANEIINRLNRSASVDGPQPTSSPVARDIPIKDDSGNTTGRLLVLHVAG